MKLEMSKEQINILDIMNAYKKGKTIERLASDHVWDVYEGDEFDTDRKYRIAKRMPIKDFLAMYIYPLWEIITSDRGKNIQAGIMLGIMLGVIFYQIGYETANNIGAANPNE